MKIYTFYPSWNLTALVDHKPKSNEEKNMIEQKIFLQNPDIEQVWFIYQEDWVHKLEMAHNELCVNAIFSYLCYLDIYEDIVHGEIYLVWPDYGVMWWKIEEGNEFFIHMPTIYQHQVITFDNISLVELPWIKHIFYTGAESDFSDFLARQIDELWNIEWDFVTGVHMYTQSEPQEMSLHSFVYYHQDQRLVHETSCASGSIALVVNEVFKQQWDWHKNWKIHQLSGAVITIKSIYKLEGLNCVIRNTVFEK